MIDFQVQMPYSNKYNLKTEAASVISASRSLTDITVVAAVAANTILDGFTEPRKFSTKSLRGFPLSRSIACV